MGETGTETVTELLRGKYKPELTPKSTVENDSTIVCLDKRNIRQLEYGDPLYLFYMYAYTCFYNHMYATDDYYSRQSCDLFLVQKDFFLPVMIAYLIQFVYTLTDSQSLGVILEASFGEVFFKKVLIVVNMKLIL